MNSAQETNRTASGAWITGALFAVGIGLQFVTPLLRDRVDLSDELFIASFLYPWWFFLQVVLVAVIFGLMSGVSRVWSTWRRSVFAVVAIVILALPQPDLIAWLQDGSWGPLRLALVWSTTLAFFVVPTALVAYAWITKSPRLTMMRALAFGLIANGVLSFPHILWLNHLWEIYVRASGGGSVLTP